MGDWEIADSESTESPDASLIQFRDFRFRLWFYGDFRRRNSPSPRPAFHSTTISHAHSRTKGSTGSCSG